MHESSVSKPCGYTGSGQKGMMPKWTHHPQAGFAGMRQNIPHTVIFPRNQRKNGVLP